MGSTIFGLKPFPCHRENKTLTLILTGFDVNDFNDFNPRAAFIPDY